MQPAEIQIRTWTYTDFISRRKQWMELLACSNADPLFMSWDWQLLWWQIFGASAGHELVLLAACRGEELVGLAPLYCKSQLRKGLIPIRSLQLIGSSWRDPTCLISEYLDILAVGPLYTQVRAAFLEFILARADCSEVAICCADERQGWCDALRSPGDRRGHLVRSVDHAVSYQADLSSGFESYLRLLGESTRRKLFNLRRRLQQLGKVVVGPVEPQAVELTLHHLNRLHATRWGSPVFSGPRWQFHLAFARGAAERGQLQLSRLIVAERTVCVLYDIRIGRVQYNLQMGFDQEFGRSMSLGLLHLGYAMEQAAAAGVQAYDFLAGPGRVTSYKEHLAQRTRSLGTAQLVRHPLLARLYRWHDRRKKPESAM